MIFFNFKMQAEEFSRDLKRYHGISSVFVHGDQSQQDRMKAFEKMRLMHINLILTTDLLSRGVDLPEVRYVINFDMPLTQAEFFHRIGRSGRFGADGTAISLISDKELGNFPYVNNLTNDMSEISSVSEVA